MTLIFADPKSAYPLKKSTKVMQITCIPVKIELQDSTKLRMHRLKDLGQHLVKSEIQVVELLIPREGDLRVEHYCDERILILQFACSYEKKIYSVELEIPFVGRRAEACQYVRQIRGSSCAAFAVVSSEERESLKGLTGNWTFCLQVCPVSLPLFKISKKLNQKNKRLVAGNV